MAWTAKEIISDFGCDRDDFDMFLESLEFENPAEDGKFSERQYQILCRLWRTSGAEQQLEEQGYLSPNKPVYRSGLHGDRHDTIRHQVLADGDYRCRICGASGRPLEAHHAHYETLGTPTEHRAVISCCSSCHALADFQREKRAENNSLSRIEIIKMLQGR